jgi:hypothetical protein
VGGNALIVDSLEMRFPIVSFVRLADLHIIRPQVDLVSGGKESNWNPEEFLRTLKMSMRLEAASVVVEDGFFKVNDRKKPFHVALEDLDCEIRYVKRIPSYKIRIKYKRSRLIWEKRDIVRDLELISDLSVQGVGIDSFRFRHGASLFTGSGSMKDWNSPVWESEGSISVEKGKYDEEAFDSLQAQMKIADRRLQLMRAEVRRGNGRLNAEGQFDLSTQQLDMKTRIEGFDLEAIPVVREKQLPLHGSLGVSGNLRGTPQKPIFSGAFNLDSLQYERWYFGHGKGQIDFADGIAKGSVGIQSELGRFTIQADISNGAGYPGKAKVEFADLDVQKILPSKTPPYLQEISTVLKGKVDVEGKFEDTASLKIRDEDGKYGLDFRLRKRIR